MPQNVVAWLRTGAVSGWDRRKAERQGWVLVCRPVRLVRCRNVRRNLYLHHDEKALQCLRRWSAVGGPGFREPAMRFVFTSRDLDVIGTFWFPPP